MCGKNTEFYGTRKGHLADVRKEKKLLKEKVSRQVEQQQQVNLKGEKKTKKQDKETGDTPISTPVPVPAPAPAPSKGFTFSSFLGIQVGKTEVPPPPTLQSVGKPASSSLSKLTVREQATPIPKPSGPSTSLPAGNPKPQQQVAGLSKPKSPGLPVAQPPTQKGKQGEPSKGQPQGNPGNTGGPSRIGEGVNK